MMDSRPINVRAVFLQDTKPETARDGILWVDTSTDPNTTRAFNADTSTWEPVATSDLTVDTVQPVGETDGEMWVDPSTAPAVVSTYDIDTDTWDRVNAAFIDAQISDHAAVSGAHHSRPTATATAEVSGGYDPDYGDVVTITTGSDSGTTGSGTASFNANPYLFYDGVRVFGEKNGRSSDLEYWELRKDGVVIDSGSPSTPSKDFTLEKAFSSQQPDMSFYAEIIHTGASGASAGADFHLEPQVLSVAPHNHGI